MRAATIQPAPGLIAAARRPTDHRHRSASVVGGWHGPLARACQHESTAQKSSSIWLALAFILPALRAAAAAPDGQPHKLSLAGNDQAVWIVAEGEARPAGPPILRIFYGDRRSSGVFTTPTLPDRYGRSAGIAATSDALVVLYADGSTQWLTFSGSRSGPGWPGDAPPLAWTGDATRPDAYAVADGETIALPTTRPASTQPSGSRGTTRAAASPPPLTSTLPTGPILLRLHHQAWQFVARLPADARPADRFWLAARDGRVHIFWRDPATRSFITATHADDRWSAPTPIPDTADAADAWAAADRLGPLLITTTHESSAASTTLPSPDAGHLRVHWRKNSRWHVSAPLRDARDTIRIDPDRAGLSVARGQLALARIADRGEIQFGQSALDGDRTVAWSAATTVQGPPDVAARSLWAEWAEAIATMVVLVLIVWSRHESLGRPVPLPRTLAIAPPARRAVALLIDLAPAFLVTLWLWLPRIPDLMLIVPRLDPTLGQSWMREHTLLPLLATLGVHAAYCLVWELLAGTTPGKHLLGCRVTNESGQTPAPWQLLVRNALRIPELGITLVGLSTVFLMLVISRNAQRMGDVLAGTVVIRDVRPLARPISHEPDEPHAPPPSDNPRC